MEKKELKKAIKAAINGYKSKSFGRILKFSYPQLLQELESHTRQYNPKNITESIYILLNGAPSECSKGKLPLFSSYEHGYRQFCGTHKECECNRIAQSQKISQWQTQVTPEQRESMQVKAQTTFLENYGVTNPMLSKEVVGKIESNNIEKYGVPHHLQREDVKEKIRNSLLEKYGVDAPLKDPNIWAKTKSTSQARYGGLMTQARKGAYDKYDGKNPFEDSEVQSKRDQTMMDKYGTVHALQNPEIFSRMTDDNIQKYGKPNPAQFHYSKELWDVLQDPNKFLEAVKGKSSVQVANTFNTRSDLILSYARRHGVLDQMNFSPRSAMEDDLAEWLSLQNIPVKRNDKKILQGLEIDLLLLDHKVGIELNGLYQHSELAGGKDAKYHWHKFKGCEIKGIQLLHIWQDEYWAKKAIIQSKILYLTKRISNRIAARKCVIKPIVDVAEESQFLNTNHIQGFADYRQWSMGAWYEDRMVGVMSFAHRKGRLELVRYVTDISSVCNGLFSKLFDHSCKEFKFSGKIISQSDNRVSNGNLYLSTGWQYEGEQTPAYCYTGDYTTRNNKEHYMKSKLIKKFGLSHDYVTSHTEWHIMQELGYDRLWDAGKKIWSKTV